MKQSLRIAAVMVAFATSSAATAAYVVDTGAGGDYSGSVIDPGQSIAARFTLTADTLVTSAEGHIAGNGGGTGVITIYGGGATPGAILYSGKFAPAPISAPGEWQGVFRRSWLLTAGTYWIGFSTNRFNYLTWSALNPLELEAYDDGGGWNSFNVPIAVRLSDSPPPIPEPTSWVLMIAGFAMAGTSFRRWRAATT